MEINNKHTYIRNIRNSNFINTMELYCSKHTYIRNIQTSVIIDAISKGLTNLHFIKCIITNVFFEQLEHFQTNDPLFATKRLCLTFYDCTFELPIVNYQICFQELWFDDATFLDVVWDPILEFNKNNLEVLAVSRVNESTLRKFSNLNSLHCFDNSQVPLSADIIENNPRLEYLQIDENNIHALTSTLNFRNIHLVGTFHKLPKALACTTVGNTLRANEYNTNVKWIRFVVGILQWVQGMNHAHGHAILDILKLYIFPCVRDLQPTWWKDDLCVDLFVAAQS